MTWPVLMSRFDWRAKGVPAAGFMLRVTSSAPKRRLKATCVSSSSAAPRKRRTECSSKAARMATQVGSSSGRLMSAPSIRTAKQGLRRVTVIGMSGVSRNRSVNAGQQGFGIHRLDQVRVEARLHGLAAIIGLPVAGEGHEIDGRAGAPAHAPGELIAVEAGQP